MSLIKKSIKYLLKPIISFAKDSNFRRRLLYSYYFERVKIRNNVVFYESYHGKSMNDNPYAIFSNLINNPRFSGFIHVWALNENNPYSDAYRENKNVIFVKVGSRPYLKYLTSAKYLINNVTFPTYFQKRSEQIYLNTWHGTPLKTLGKDMGGEIGQHKNIQRNFLQADYILSPNRFTSNVLIESHDLKGIYPGIIVEEGYPRIDLTFRKMNPFIKSYLSKIFGEDISRKKIVLYAPTWRGEVGKTQNKVDEIKKYILAIKSSLPEDFILILKVHTLVYKFIKNDTELQGICIPDWLDTNELLAATDVLITDYSSIFFDFLVTDKPIIFFMYDKEEYLQSRGLYIKESELPGPICTEIEELGDVLNQIEEVGNTFKEQYLSFKLKFCRHEDGEVSNRIAQVIVGDLHNINYFKVDDHKQNILMYCGGFLNNGITSSVINLLNNIDYDKYNVAIVDKGKYDNISTLNLLKINNQAKRFYRVGSMNATLLEVYRNMIIQKLGIKSKFHELLVPRKLYKREISRLFGNSKFDIVIDFSGYVPFWSSLFSFGDFSRKVIYQHNDMLAELNKKVNGVYKHRINLNVVFSLYKYFDKIVSVSEHTKNLNALNLNLPREKVATVNNSIDYTKIINESKERTAFEYDNTSFFINKFELSGGRLSFSGFQIPTSEHINFVNMGRMSPEKDQEKLIFAFSNVLEKFSNAKLYIIGSGILEKKLKKLVNQLNIKDHVIFTGQLENPFALIKMCDCFVLSSNHEGQPMVLLETLVLNKPIVSTDIPGSRSVLEGGFGELVENSIDGIANGMIKYLEGNMEFKSFDFVEYNNKAMEMFYTEVCGFSPNK
ncbi:CDP-glycerol glycerophosphotransferase [Paenibacillus rhizosphaerae]|uniref:CDP-glycerol glycerophosphotransferase n=1 Tax=Paenibacillus rhizosphaerae TaxID=297318 RepID=A0A839U0E2_9BACL|nr:glycosyltransferase [Paenibacillus rhizosphaerae]MBB3130939.1 CDP-glycerol glycerophosphotransferase [Paenibacillus rhizosphaerae]